MTTPRISSLQSQLWRAKEIIKRWIGTDLLTEDDVERVFSGDYYFYVTFTDASEALGIVESKFAILQGPKTMKEADTVAQTLFDGHVKKVYSEWEFEPRLYEGVAKIIKTDTDDVSVA